MNARQKVQTFYLQALREKPRNPIKLIAAAQVNFGVKPSTARTILLALQRSGLVTGRTKLKLVEKG